MNISKYNYYYQFIQGPIPATVTALEKPTILEGASIYSEPRCFILEPSSYASSVLEFSSNVQGHFVEEFEYMIEQSQQILKVQLV